MCVWCWMLVSHQQPDLHPRRHQLVPPPPQQQQHQAVASSDAIFFPASLEPTTVHVRVRSPLADSFLVLMILAAYSCPEDFFTHLRTTEKAPLPRDRNRVQGTLDSQPLVAALPPQGRCCACGLGRNLQHEPAEPQRGRNAAAAGSLLWDFGVFFFLLLVTSAGLLAARPLAAALLRSAAASSSY